MIAETAILLARFAMASVTFAGGTSSAEATGRGDKSSSKSGYLLKRSSVKVWQKRWFVLEAGELSYFRSFEQCKQEEEGQSSCCGFLARKKGQIKFEDHKLQTNSEADDAEINHEIDFVLLVDGEKVLLRATTTEEKKAWVKALNSAYMIRSYSSKQLSLVDRAPISFPDLSLDDLDIGEVLGSGTTGTVKLAVHLPTGMRCAVKIIAKRKFFFNKQLEETTRREIEILNKMMEMNHRNIVQCFGHIDDPSYIYIVMELCEGGELLEQLEHLGKYTEEDTSEVIRNLISTLTYLHAEGIVHRDIKPENLLLADSTDLCNVKIADFGLASVLEGDEKMSVVCGSPAYMAPEIQNGGEYSAACDMYSVGVMMYLMLCGSLPFQGEGAAKKMADENFNFDDQIWDLVSPGAKDVISKLLVADSSKRLSCSDALQHPWVTGEETGSVYLKQAQRKIVLFNAKRKFKGIAHAVIASNRMKNLMAGLQSASKEVAIQAQREAEVMRGPSHDFENENQVQTTANPIDAVE
eukprot:SAG31_NODE_513_length_14715_cov_22.844554_5_plen_523_part_00